MKYPFIISKGLIASIATYTFFLILFSLIIEPESSYAGPGSPPFLATVEPPRTLIVDRNHTLSSDTNPGSLAFPLKTIQVAMDIAKANRRMGIGTKIRVFPGIYREEVSLLVGKKENDPPIILEGTELGNVIISGSEIWSDWQLSYTPHVYVHDWPYHWGRVPLPHNWPSSYDRPILRRREMIFVDKQLHMQVRSPEALDSWIFLRVRTGTTNLPVP